MPIRETLPPGIHEAGWMSKGWPWRRQHAMHCNTCGRTTAYVRNKSLVQAAAQLHSGNPATDVGRTLIDFDRIAEALKLL